MILHCEAIETFPFERMAATMEAVNWKWFMGRPPDYAEIQLEASSMLRDIAKDSHVDSIRCGGLIAYKDGTIAFETKSDKKKECIEAWEAQK